MRRDPIIAKPGDVPADAEHVYGSASGQALEDYRQRYGLSVDPFGEDQYFPFFTGSQRRELQDQILHLCQFGHSIPVILGERGVGKTRLALAGYESLGDDHACFISALPTSNAELLLRQIAQHFEIRCSDDETEDQLITKLTHLAATSSDDIAVAIIDNVHDLDDQTLRVLLALRQSLQSDDGGAVKLVLCGDLSLAGRLEQLQLNAGVAQLYVERFSLSETVAYLNFRMEMADYLGPDMFTEANVEPWWRGAHGQLIVIHRLAHEHLLEAVMPPLSRGSRPFPILHIVAIALLGGVVLMTFLYRGNVTEHEVADAQRVPINLQQRPPEAAPASAMNATNSNSSADTLSITSEAALAETDASSPSFSAADQAPTLAVLNPAHEQLTSSVSPKEAEAVPEPQVVKSTAIADAPSVTPANPQQANPTRSTRTLTRDEEALLSWATSDFTLQLLGVSTEKAARDFIAQQSNRDDLLTFKTLRQGKNWFVVVAGRYTSATAAKTAIQALPSEQAKAGPWPRELKVIQKEITDR